MAELFSNRAGVKGLLVSTENETFTTMYYPQHIVDLPRTGKNLSQFAMHMQNSCFAHLFTDIFFAVGVMFALSP